MNDRYGKRRLTVDEIIDDIKFDIRWQEIHQYDVRAKDGAPRHDTSVNEWLLLLHSFWIQVLLEASMWRRRNLLIRLAGYLIRWASLIDP